jgi:hypothetical protein
MDAMVAKSKQQPCTRFGKGDNCIVSDMRSDVYRTGCRECKRNKQRRTLHVQIFPGAVNPCGTIRYANRNKVGKRFNWPALALRGTDMYILVKITGGRMSDWILQHNEDCISRGRRHCCPRLCACQAVPPPSRVTRFVEADVMRGSGTMSCRIHQHLIIQEDLSP